MELGDIKNLQANLDRYVQTKVVSEGLGRNIIYLVSRAIVMKRLYDKYNDFQIEYIVRPGLEDLALNRIRLYSNEKGTAKAFFNNVLGARGIADINRLVNFDRKGVFENIVMLDDLEPWQVDALMQEEYEDMSVYSDLIVTIKKEII